MTARLLGTDDAGIACAAEIIRAGGLVAFPTETVYGLGAHALDAPAVKRIFEAKGRPANDPVIVHLEAARQLARVAVPNGVAERLAERFWPGPLTLVLPKLPEVPPEVTAGLQTVAVRVPAHPVAQALLQAANLPIAAPSANLFSRPSPTRAEHVLEDLGERIDAIVDGGPTPLGVESTIVDLSTEQPRLLRAGGLPAEEIETLLGQTLLLPLPPSRPVAPGMLPVHYSPRTPRVLITGLPEAARARLQGEIEAALAQRQRVGVLLLADDEAPPGARVEVLGSYPQPSTTAARLFDALRSLDRQGLDILYVRELADPHTGLGRALADRLRRAASRLIEA
jgi:L-threonylcarbamoyladenylate synthase